MRLETLKLYKDLMKYGQKLKLTDQRYFTFKVRKDFNLNRNLTDENDIKFYIQKGRQLLKEQKII